VALWHERLVSSHLFIKILMNFSFCFGFVCIERCFFCQAVSFDCISGISSPPDPSTLDDVRRLDDEQPQGTVAWEVLCAPTEFAHVRQGLSEKLAPPIPVSRNPTERVQPPLPGSGKLAIGESGIEMLPLALTAVAGEDAKSVLELVEELEDNEDIKKVYTNADIADDVLAAMGD
jgi:transcriptional/translational regulatory protein YebC/TACO1